MDKRVLLVFLVMGIDDTMNLDRILRKSTFSPPAKRKVQRILKNRAFAHRLLVIHKKG